jgi:hypothetical protein
MSRSGVVRWACLAVLAIAVMLRWTPVAYAGCDGGDSTAGHNAIGFCCGEGPGDRGHDKDGHGGPDRGGPGDKPGHDTGGHGPELPGHGGHK